MFTSPDLNYGPYFMHRDVCVIHLISLYLPYFSWGRCAGFHITYAGCKPGCHSPFNAFKSDHWSVAGLFKTLAVYNGGYSSFRKFLFIDCRSVLVEEPVPDIVLNLKEAPKVMFRKGDFSLIRKPNIALYESWRGSSPPPPSAYSWLLLCSKDKEGTSRSQLPAFDYRKRSLVWGHNVDSCLQKGSFGRFIVHHIARNFPSELIADLESRGRGLRLIQCSTTSL